MDILAIICRATAVIASALSLLPTYAAWKSKALGPGGRWPDPILAALFGNAAWFAFGCIQGSDEAFWLNGICGVVQMVNLGFYVALCPEDRRLDVLQRFLLAGGYLAFTVWVGLVHDSVDLFKVFCTLSGFAAAFVPIITTVYTSGRKTVDLLPHWAVSLVSLTNAVLWVVRGLLILNIPVAIQNGAGAIASVWFLVLLFVWDDEQANENDYVPVSDGEDNSGSDDDETSEPADDTEQISPGRNNAMDVAARGDTTKDERSDVEDEEKDRLTGDSLHKSSGRTSAAAQGKLTMDGDDKTTKANTSDIGDMNGDDKTTKAETSDIGHMDGDDKTPKAKTSDIGDMDGGDPTIKAKTSDIVDDKSYVNEKTGCSSQNSLGGRDTTKAKISDIGDEMSYVNDKTQDSSQNPTGGASDSAYKDQDDVENKAGGSGGAPNKTSPVPAAPEAEIVEEGVQE